jgi:pantetheine-phosphate adenylyltransferase
MTIGIYAGSFNPFHKGHYDILIKAEQIFDKVIIVRGVNPEKAASDWPLPNIISDREIMILNDLDLITEVVKSLQDKGNKVTIIRGLRNTHDLQAEMNYYYVLQDLMPKVQMISIFTDRFLPHVSSSLVRSLVKFGKDKYSDYLLD